MTVQMTPEQAARWLQGAVTRLQREMLTAEREALALVTAEALRLSAGTLRTADLVRMGHPYRIGGSPPQDPAIINEQTGRFLASWEKQGPQVGGGRIVSTLENTAPYAKYLAGGTTKMIRRPLVGRVIERTAAKVHDLRRDAVRRAFTTGGAP